MVLVPGHSRAPVVHLMPPAGWAPACSSEQGGASEAAWPMSATCLHGIARLAAGCSPLALHTWCPTHDTIYTWCSPVTWQWFVMHAWTASVDDTQCAQRDPAAQARLLPSGAHRPRRFGQRPRLPAALPSLRAARAWRRLAAAAAEQARAAGRAIYPVAGRRSDSRRRPTRGEQGPGCLSLLRSPPAVACLRSSLIPLPLSSCAHAGCALRAWAQRA